MSALGTPNVFHVLRAKARPPPCLEFGIDAQKRSVRGFFTTYTPRTTTPPVSLIFQERQFAVWVEVLFYITVCLLAGWLGFRLYQTCRKARASRAVQPEIVVVGGRRLEERSARGAATARQM